MRNCRVNEIANITGNDKHITYHLLHEAHIIMKLHVQIRAILYLHYASLFL